MEVLTTGILTAPVLLSLMKQGQNFRPQLYSLLPDAKFVIPEFTEIRVYAACGTDGGLSAMEAQLREDGRMLDVDLEPADLVHAAIQLLPKAEFSYDAEILACQAAFMILDDPLHMLQEGTCVVAPGTASLIPGIRATVFA